MMLPVQSLSTATWLLRWRSRRLYGVGGRKAANCLTESIATCLELAGVRPDQVDCVAVVRPIPAAQESSLHLNLRARFPQSRMALIDHHRAHAASAFYASPFDEATVLVLDRHGDFRCGSRWHAADGRLLRLEKELYSPDSLGELYGRVTELLGFNANADEHKVQWLSAAGADGHRELFLEILQVFGRRFGPVSIDPISMPSA